MLRKTVHLIGWTCMILAVLAAGCVGTGNPESYPDLDREEKLPDDVSKRGPETDQYPPILHSIEYEDPVPLPYPVNTVGGEDCPVILPDGNTLYFFFTPDVRLPIEKQLLEGVTGTYVSYRSGDS